jgi:electron transfer flavoprotein beta subunit
MRTVICLKTILDPEAIEFDIDREELWNKIRILDPIGDNLLEQGLAIREIHGGQLLALSVAPDSGTGILENALRYGVDRSIRIWHEDLKDADTWMVSQILAEELRKIEPDLIFCGTRSRDTGSCLMVSALAYHLNTPSSTGIIGLEIGSRNEIIAYKKLEKGKRETYSLNLPAVLGLEEGINEPRYVAPFSRIYCEGMNRKVEYHKPDLSSINPNQLTQNLRFVQPRPRVKTGIDVSKLSVQDRLKMMRGELGREEKERFEGSPEEAAKKIYQQLKGAIA